MLVTGQRWRNSDAYRLRRKPCTTTENSETRAQRLCQSAGLMDTYGRHPYGNHPSALQPNSASRLAHHRLAKHVHGTVNRWTVRTRVQRVQRVQCDREIEKSLSFPLTTADLFSVLSLPENLIIVSGVLREVTIFIKR